VQTAGCKRLTRGLSAWREEYREQLRAALFPNTPFAPER
jgi:hypothetical protein